MPNELTIVARHVHDYQSLNSDKLTGKYAQKASVFTKDSCHHDGMVAM